MERKHVSRASIAIEASSADIWDALVNPATAKAYFFGAEVHSDWKEGSPITFTGEFNDTSYHEKGTILRCQPQRLLQYSHWSGAGASFAVAQHDVPARAPRALRSPRPSSALAHARRREGAVDGREPREA